MAPTRRPTTADRSIWTLADGELSLLAARDLELGPSRRWRLWDRGQRRVSTLCGPCRTPTLTKRPAIVSRHSRTSSLHVGPGDQHDWRGSS